jgi:hypothetical protein
MSIDWQPDYDDYDAVSWEGDSPFADHHGEDCFKWRVRRRDNGTRVEWYADHDAECGGETGEFWLTLDEAKAAIQAQHDAIIAQYAAEAEEVNQP